MPWKNVLPMEENQRFVNLMESGHFTVNELCQEYGVSRKTGHKWLARYAEAGRAGLEDREQPKGVTRRNKDGESGECDFEIITGRG
jgi:transposase-like protein